MKFAVTGAAGFVGRGLCAHLLAQGHEVVPIVRSSAGIPNELVIGDIVAPTTATTNADVFVHLAARAHVMNDDPAGAESAYFQANVQGTRHAVEMAARSGARRFVYVSSVKALGERSYPGRPLRVENAAAPEDAYGRSKLAAEALAGKMTADLGLELVIVRPPLVYGPGVRGNFELLVRMASSGLPLPLGSLDNRRSMISLANLVDLLRVVALHPDAAGLCILPSDGDDLSTARLVRIIAAASNKKAMIFPFPPQLIVILARLFGKRDMLDRVVGNLQVDDSDTLRALGWQPVQSVEDGIGETVRSLI